MEQKNYTTLTFIIIALVIIAGGLFIYQGTKDEPMVTGTTNPTKTMENETQDGVMVGGALMVDSKDIVDNAAGADNLTTLVAAVQATGLVETLKSSGPFTVFAPINSAFENLPAGTVETLLKPENKEKLTSILTYHVVAGSVKASDLRDGMMVKTVNGEELKVTIKDGKVMINDATVIIADVMTSNGVIHAVDSVLLPK